jgi:hypothetical protein
LNEKEYKKMLKQLKSHLLKTTLVCGASVHALTQRNETLCEEPVKKHREMIAVYLKPESKQLLEKYLNEKGYTNKTADYVCVHSHADSVTTFVYQPLYGDRVAFRLKGFIELPDEKQEIAIGRLSSIAGEIKESQFEVSMPLYDKDKKSEVDFRTVTDIPTRLRKIMDFSKRNNWKGRIPAETVDGKTYDPVPAQYIALPMVKQLVIEGYLCSNHHVDENGKCLYKFEVETLTDDEEEIREIEKMQEMENTIIKKSEEKPVASTEEAKDIKECPVCKYMKAGSCKEEFIQWDACIGSLKEGQEVTECISQTYAMMKCMQKDEYYDIMTAGMDPGKIDVLESSSKNKEHKEPASEQNTSKKE